MEGLLLPPADVMTSSKALFWEDNELGVVGRRWPCSSTLSLKQCNQVRGSLEDWKHEIEPWCFSPHS